MKKFKLPDLGEGLQEAEVREWKVKEGDEIKINETLLTVETDKANVEIPSPYTGKVLKIHAAEDAIVEVGALLVEFETSGKTASNHSNGLKIDEPAAVVETATKNEPEVVVEIATENDSKTVVGQLAESTGELMESATGIKISESVKQIKTLPAVRMLARSLGIKLETITATGKEDNITLDDLKNVIDQVSKKDAGSDKILIKEKITNDGYNQLKGSRRAMAKNMGRSNQEVAQITLFDDADIHHWSKQTDFTLRIINAIIHACQSESTMNAHFRSRDIAVRRFNHINLGIAVDTPKGLFVPVIKNVGSLSAGEIRANLNTFKLKAASQTFSQDETQGATFYLSNFGTIAGKYATPIVSPPTVSIVGIGRSFTDLKYIEGGIHPRLMLPISLSADHRAVTGGEVARFLRHLMDKLES
jgi:2-oxoisovalerate dehydrogenase E2 component (dihydrolipoyl transacylase)